MQVEVSTKVHSLFVLKLYQVYHGKDSLDRFRTFDSWNQPCEIEALLRLAGQAQATARRREAASRCAATTKGNNENLNVEKQRAGLQRCETFDMKRPHFDQG